MLAPPCLASLAAGGWSCCVMAVGCRDPLGPGSERFGNVFAPFPSSPSHCFDFLQSFSWARWGWRGHLLFSAEKGEVIEKGVTRLG